MQPIEEPQTVSDNILMRMIKIVDIGYITVLYMICSMVFAALTDSIMGQFDPSAEAKKSTMRLSAELVLTVWLYGVLIYVVRNLVELVPFPMDKYHGFNHRKVKELGSAMVFTFTFMLFSNYLKSKIIFYYNYTINPIVNQDMTNINKSVVL